MDNQPPVYGVQPNWDNERARIRDDEHLKLLSIFHFVVGGLALLGIAFLCVHYLIFSQIFMHPERWQIKGPMPPVEFFKVFIWFYFFMGIIFVTASILNILSGIFLRQRRHRIFSIVVASLNCLHVPFGTVLGVFTIIALVRDSVRQSYID